ncbi:MAG: sulfite exporter TauE/SafE family protein [Rhodospirillales bacterium]|nr:sulfite exporter TauE/SafE family protein [Rhodospirillales bacterium]
METDPLLLQLLSTGIAHCRAAVGEHEGLLASLFMAGLLGSITHCVGMCGPFVLAQTVSRLEDRPAAQMHEWHRLAGAALVPYHLGRATTYAALGAAAAALAAGMIHVTGLRWLSAALLVLAASFFFGYAVRQVSGRWAVRLPVRLPGDTGDSGWSNRVRSLVRPLFARPIGWRGYLIGVALGFLPCGLLYGALAAAAASGRPLAGALAMLAFTFGTVPSLVAVGFAGHVAGRQFRGAALRLMPALMLINAAALSYLAWRTII